MLRPIFAYLVAAATIYCPGCGAWGTGRTKGPWKLPQGRSMHTGVGMSSHHHTPDPSMEEAHAAADLAREATAWASAHGLQMVHPDHDDGAAFVHAPLSVLPNAIPKAQFDDAVACCGLWNRLVDRIACDREWIRDTLKAVAATDAFTARLLGLMEESDLPELRLGVHRSDYMLHGPTGQFLQIELNTIASSFGCVSSKVTDMHRFLVGRWKGAEDAARLPVNPTLSAIPAAMAKAHTSFTHRYHTSLPGGAAAAQEDVEPVVLFVVQPGERNVVDQRMLEHALWEYHGIRVVRRTMAEISTSARIDPHTGALHMDDSVVSVAYFRAGYTPADYPSEREWDARRLIELSSAVACPCVSYHLAGTKKVQQQLAREGELERFLSSEDAALLRKTFAGLYSLETGDGGGFEGEARDAVHEAIDHPQAFVLKPQREGGGNNFYGDQLAKKLLTAFHEDGSVRERGDGCGLPELILMQRILPPSQPAALVVNGETSVCRTLSELGVFSTVLAEGVPSVQGSRRHHEDEVRYLEDAYAGHILRTKPDGTDEGGVATGYAVLSSPMLVE